MVVRGSGSSRLLGGLQPHLDPVELLSYGCRFTPGPLQDGGGLSELPEDLFVGGPGFGFGVAGGFEAGLGCCRGGAGADEGGRDDPGGAV
ncbi:hypothetical protein ACIPW5_29495 [Streptomyces sp. NPDC090077]|uniref:hypothetical protein n=1 Tax=Streptomyces sp. NPDC090077 TaxID=3365938 RepID=UPI0037F5F76E